MLRLRPCLLLILLVALGAKEANGLAGGTCSGAGGTCTGETNADTCDSSSECQCNIGWDGTADNCAQKDCDGTDSTPITTDCGGDHTACDGSDKCICQVNYVVAGTACNPIQCTTANAASICTPGDNDYCDTTAGTCACKKNYVGTNLADCAQVSCATDACTEPNSACDGADKCVCDHLSATDATSGACTRKTCTVATVATVCGKQAECELNPNALQCVCKVNFATSHSGTACTQKLCTGASTSSCDPNSACASDGNCQCASTHTASGSRCKRTCSNDETVCDSNAACVSDLCECNVNYQGGGGSSDCTQMECTGNDTTTCHPNSQCVNSKCQCANDYEPSGTTCVTCPTGWKSDGTVCKKTCTSDTGCGPTTAVCTSERCECATNYVGNGTTCAAKSCTANSDCTSASNYTCTSGSCACASGFSFSDTERDCIMNAGGIVLYSLSLMMAALLLSIFTNKM